MLVGIKNSRLLAAMRKHRDILFVDPGTVGSAPMTTARSLIGEKQTVSQPYMAARMTEALELSGEEKVLEIGTGSGYQTALLAELSFNVFSVEKIRTLAMKAESRCWIRSFSIITSPFRWAMAASGGPSTRLLMRLSSPQARQICPGLCSSNWRSVAGWSYR